MALRAAGWTEAQIERFHELDLDGVIPDGTPEEREHTQALMKFIKQDEFRNSPVPIPLSSWGHPLPSAISKMPFAIPHRSSRSFVIRQEPTPLFPHLKEMLREFSLKQKLR